MERASPGRVSFSKFASLLRRIAGAMNVPVGYMGEIDPGRWRDRGPWQRRARQNYPADERDQRPRAGRPEPIGTYTNQGQE